MITAYRTPAADATLVHALLADDPDVHITEGPSLAGIDCEWCDREDAPAAARVYGPDCRAVCGACVQPCVDDAVAERDDLDPVRVEVAA